MGDLRIDGILLGIDEMLGILANFVYGLFRSRAFVGQKRGVFLLGFLLRCANLLIGISANDGDFVSVFFLEGLRGGGIGFGLGTILLDGVFAFVNIFEDGGEDIALRSPEEEEEEEKLDEHCSVDGDHSDSDPVCVYAPTTKSMSNATTSE